jgi:3-dehydroquinate dehydratase-1
MSNQSVSIPQSPLVVGSVQSLNQLACLQPVELKGLCDILEVRLDGMPSHIDTLNIELDRFNDFPLLFTARCASEGGLSDLSSRERAKLLTEVSKRAAWIDVELASYADMKDTLHQIRSEGVGLILSYHNFTETPQTSQLQDIVDLAGEADIIKIAVQHNNASDLTRCVETLQNNDHPMSMMGMGPLAPVSRLLYAQHGSLLNYGYLGNTETAPGQWPAKLLREAIATLEPIS